MSDRFERVVPGLIGLAVAACLATAAFLRPVGLPTQARSEWIRAADQQQAGRPLAGRTFYVDAVLVGQQEQPYDGRAFAVPAGSRVAVRGWAFDPGYRRTADVMLFRLDGGAWHEAQYHLPRPDVAQNLSLPNVADSGFLADLPGTLRPGKHALQLATRAAPYGPNLLPVRIAFDVRGR